MSYPKTLAMRAADLNTAVIHTQKKLIDLLMAMDESQVYTVSTRAVCEALAIAEFQFRVLETQFTNLEL